MDSHFEHGGLYLDRSPAEIKELVSRLNRLEGQIRGIRAMIEDGRHCRDELQQINAASAALRKVAAILASQHVAAGNRPSHQRPEPRRDNGGFARLVSGRGPARLGGRIRRGFVAHNLTQVILYTGVQYIRKGRQTPVIRMCAMRLQLKSASSRSALLRRSASTNVNFTERINVFFRQAAAISGSG